MTEMNISITKIVDITYRLLALKSWIASFPSSLANAAICSLFNFDANLQLNIGVSLNRSLSSLNGVNCVKESFFVHIKRLKDVSQSFHRPKINVIVNTNKFSSIKTYQIQSVD